MCRMGKSVTLTEQDAEATLWALKSFDETHLLDPWQGSSKQKGFDRRSQGTILQRLV
jgi:hypothetical protein